MAAHEATGGSVLNDRWAFWGWHDNVATDTCHRSRTYVASRC